MKHKSENLITHGLFVDDTQHILSTNALQQEFLEKCVSAKDQPKVFIVLQCHWVLCYGNISWYAGPANRGQESQDLSTGQELDLEDILENYRASV